MPAYVHEKTGVRFQYNSDLSGDAIVDLGATVEETRGSVPAASLLAFADHARKEPGDDLTLAGYAEIGRTWCVEHMIAQDRDAGILPEAQRGAERDDLEAGAPELWVDPKIPTAAQLGVIAILADAAVSAGVLDTLPDEKAALAAFRKWIGKPPKWLGKPPECPEWTVQPLEAIAIVQSMEEE